MTTTRRLAAILAADVVGYSRLMGADEEGTLKRLVENQRAVIDPTVARSGGRIVKTTGDGFLIEFPSAVEAVRCALDIQEQVGKHEKKHEPERRFQFRIGINVGDVIASDDDIHGDGVNIAARLEALADPGGILVSGNAHEMATGRVDCTFEDAGEQSLKNIAQPVRAYWVKSGSTEQERPSLPLPDKPSIAVLPFQNMSGDPEQEYFADGMVEEIITGLSRVRSFFVIARHSTFTYKGRAVDVKQVGRELGVRYVFEGSVRKAGSRVRITGQLIDTATGTHLWADRFDGALEDVFELQDRVTESVVMAIEPTIRSAEIERALRKPTNDLRAYDLVLRALPHMHSHVRERLQEAVQLLRQAISVDPRCALAYVLLARCLGYLISSSSPDKAREFGEIGSELVSLARTAIECGKDDPEVLAIAGLIVAQGGGDFEGGSRLIEKSLSLHPRSIEGLTIGGIIYIHLGDIKKAVDYLQQAERINPLEGGYIRNWAMAFAHFVERRYEPALQLLDVSLRENPTYLPALRLRVVILGLLGRQEDAQSAVQQLLLLAPGWTVSRMQTFLAFMWKGIRNKQDVLDRYYDGFRRAGLPE